MTKLEYGKCEKLMNMAIIKAKQAQEEYINAEKHLENGNSLEWEIEQRKADMHYGEADGIKQVLVALNFAHDGMKILSYLLNE